MINIPRNIQKIIRDNTYTLDSVGMSTSQVMMFEEMVLKIQPENEETENEYEIMKWLEGKLPVPKVLCYETKDGVSYMLMSRVKGKMACDEFYMKRPELLVEVLAKGLKQLWSVDVSKCLCNNDLDKKLRMAKYNVEHGLVDEDDAEQGTFGEEGFKNPEQLLEWLVEHRPSEEPVLSHGDFCLPNIFAEDDSVSGYIDLGKMGKADKWQDIALCYRSLKHNYEGKYGEGVYECFEPNLLFEKLELEPDWEKINYYILLDELF